MNRTLVERIKFDNNLNIGISRVDFTHNAKCVKTLVEITARGKVRCLQKPADTAVHAIWNTVKGDTMVNDGAIIVLANKPDILQMFDEPPKAVIALTV